jgi:predicted neuraminidase
MINKNKVFFIIKISALILFIILSIILLNSKIVNKNTPFFNLRNQISLESKPYFKINIIPQPKFLKSAHSASIDSIGNNQLIATWFAGSHEGAPDVEIWQSFYRNNKWTLANNIVSKESIANSLKVLVRKIGNSVVYKSKNGALYLFVVYVSFGGWSGSKIVYFKSLNNGISWLDPRAIILSPVFNISNLIRTRAITLEDGSFYLPMYHEAIFNYPEIAYFDKYGNYVSVKKIKNATKVIQPSLVSINENMAYIYLRNHVAIDAPLYMQTSYDYGYSWSNLIKTNIENQDSSIATIKLPNNMLLMVRNVLHRDNLVISISKDGYNWIDIFNLEKGVIGDEFSYPAITYADGYVNILYTWQRKFIKHIRFNLIWLKQKIDNREIE